MLRPLLAVSALAIGLAVPASASAAPSKLVGTDGPGYTIKLTRAGRKVTKLKAGKYTFVIHDRSSIHSFGLDGPKGFAKDFTSVPFVGTKTFTVNLKAGKYKYYCAHHESTMFGYFVVR
jgi:plastocyanin